MNFKEAVELSIKKWEFISKNDYFSHQDAYAELREKLPELNKLKACCGLCDFFYQFYNVASKMCIKCPLNNPKSCFRNESDYANWIDHPSAKNAKIILAKLKAINIEEFLKQFPKYNLSDTLVFKNNITQD